jgi:NADPH-dependent glutamate synthase beta subunit-like oxidoreductase
MAMTLKVAIIGSGPAGYYTAEALIDQLGDGVQIDMIDRLPTPYGLIRGGVAPDHQSIKGVSRRYEQTASQPQMRFLGNIEIGDAISIHDLKALYHVVVLATGAPLDRTLGLPGENLPGVIGSAAFVGWYNSHPDFRELPINLNVKSVAVIGNGNVAVDVARVLAKTPDEMLVSDLARHAAEVIHDSPIEDIYVLGRRGPLEASFTPKELGEMGELTDTDALADPNQMPPADIDATLEPAMRKVMVKLRGFAANQPTGKPRRVHFRFYSRPVEVLGDKAVTGLRIERTVVEDGRARGTGEMTDLPVGLVIPCIGYRTRPIPGLPFDDEGGRFRNTDGLIQTGIYCVGWARRGPSGTIGTNRPDGIGVAQAIVASAATGERAGSAGLDALIAQRDLWPVTFAGWKQIEAAEELAASQPTPRVKFSRIDDMLAVVREPS